MEQSQGGDDDEDTFALKIGDTYQTREDAEAKAAKMITTIDDILQVIREMPPASEADGEKRRYLKLIHRNDDLMKPFK